MSRMQELENIFMKAKELHQYVAVVFQIKGMTTNEIIINHPTNIDTKLAYYKKTYADNGEHKFTNEVKIVDAVRGSTFNTLEAQLKYNMISGESNE